MRKSIGRFFLIFALVMSVVVVQNVFATETEIVIGTITDISTETENIIVVDGMYIYGVKINYLLNKYSIDVYEIQENETEVIILAYVRECKDGSEKLMASKFTVGDATVTLREIP